MTKLFFLLTLIALKVPALAQEDFQGKIAYDVSGDFDKTQQAEMIVYFKKDKLMMFFYTNDKSKPTSENVLINLNDKKSFNLNTFQKSFTEDTLNINAGIAIVTNLVPIAGKRNLLGYTCSAFKNPAALAKNKNSDLEQITCWYADSLLFHFDTSIRYAQTLPILSNGTGICLETEVINNSLHVPLKLRFKARQIDRFEVPDSIFNIPSDYKLNQGWSVSYDSASSKSDSLLHQLDSLKNASSGQITQSYRKKSHPQKPTSKNTNKQPTKTAANKPKV